MAANGDFLSKQILLIEDDDDCRDLLGEVLGIPGHRCAFAGNADEARGALAGSAAFDIVLSDIRMPGVRPDGEIVTVIRESGYRGPLVLMSGDPDVREIAKRYGVEFMPKPLDIEALLTRIAR